MVTDVIKSLGDKPETVKSFYRETLSVIINYNSPMVWALNSMIDKSIDYLTKTVLSSPDEFLPEFVTEHGLGKYFISKGVFSARASVSIALAESAVLKSMIGVIKESDPLKLVTNQPLGQGIHATQYLESGFHLIPKLIWKSP